MNLSARPLILAALAYYAVMILVYLGREVEGGGLGKAVRIAGVGYFLSMVIFWLEREVLSDVQVVEGDTASDEGDKKAQQSTSR